MLPYVVAFGLLLHLLFWGAGLSMLGMPRPWRRFWPVLAAPAGMALQSLVVWLGAYANLRGTASYGWPSEAVPAILLAAGLWRRRSAAFREVARFGGLAGAMAVVLASLVRPLTQAASGLTTATLGNCDPADYAAGARVLMDYARSDRSGFIGLTEVVRGPLSVDNFFDFWLKLNHFTPSALIALNGTIFHCAPYEITSLMTFALTAGLLPVVFWIAHAVFRYGSKISVGIAALFGFSPILWYAAYQAALGQLVAAGAIGLITWAGVALWRGRLDGRRARAFAGVLGIAYALVLGGYNFIVVVCLVPAVAYAGGLALRAGRWRRLFRWTAAMILPLVIMGALFWERVVGIWERFQLFATFDFGWRIPVLSPEAWLGMTTGPGLEPYAGFWRPALALIVVAFLAEAVRRGLARRDPRPYLAGCLAVPVLFGYAYLEARGARLGTNASYDAYKLFSVFYPELLPAFCLWVTVRRPPSGKTGAAARMPGSTTPATTPRGYGVIEPALAVALGLGAALLSLNGVRQFGAALKGQGLVVDRDLAQVRRIEDMPGVDSLNMRLGTPTDLWARLWANAFLLRIPQYFPTDTYEGRWHTPLLGNWDLDDGIVKVGLPGGGSDAINPEYSVVRIASPYYFRAWLGEGWNDSERLPRSPLRWRWTRGDATLHVENPHPYALHAALRLDALSLDGRDIQVSVNGHVAGAARIGTLRAVYEIPGIAFPPGSSTVELRSPEPPAHAPSDSRPLGICVYRAEFEVAASEAQPAS